MAQEIEGGKMINLLYALGCFVGVVGFIVMSAIAFSGRITDFERKEWGEE